MSLDRRPEEPTSVGRSAVDEVILRYGTTHAAHLAGEQRALMRSAMFDLPRRSSLGWTVLHDHAPELVRRWSNAMPPEALGSRMRRLGSRPYALQPMMVLCAYLAERQQRFLDSGLTWGSPYVEPDPEGLQAVALWWRDVQHALRADGTLFPEDRGGATELLAADEAEQLADQAVIDDPTTLQTVRRLAATVELYNLIVHGEQRDGTYGHGPYALRDGSVLMVKEFNDLDNEALSWAGPSSSLGIAALVIASVYETGSGHGDLFGSFRVDVPDGLLPRTVVLAVDESGQTRPLDANEVRWFTERAAAAQQSLFVDVAGWAELDRVAYGAELFANHAAAIERACLGAGADVGLMGRFVAAGAQRARTLLDAEVPTIWSHFSDHDGPLYWPMGTV